MNVAANHELTEASLMARLVEMFGNQDVGNGTPLANAAAAAIAVDMRMADAPATAYEKLGKNALFNAAFDLQCALNNGDGATFHLPFGTKAVSLSPGGVKIGPAQYMLDSGRPGLHPLEITRQDAHGPNLERLRALIEKKTRKLACRRLGLPSASSIADKEMRHNLQFAACAEAGGVVLQRRTSETGADRFCAATPQQLSTFADSIVRDMRELWKHRAVIGTHVEAVRRAAEAHILAEHGPNAPVSITAIALELCGDTGDQPVSLYIEMDAIGETLRPGKVLEYVPAYDRLDMGFRLRDQHANRTEDLAELTALGATGRISHFSAGIAAAAPEGQAAVLADLGREIERRVVIPTTNGNVYATLYWQNGYIEADACMPGYLEIYPDRVDSRATLPDIVKAAMIDRRLDEAIALPFPLSAKISEVKEFEDGWLRIFVCQGYSLVNCDTGEIRPDPNDDGM